MSAAQAPATRFWQRLLLWLGLSPSPASAGEGRPASEADRKSVHDVTLEQLGIAHWTAHTLF